MLEIRFSILPAGDGVHVQQAKVSINEKGDGKPHPP